MPEIADKVAVSVTSVLEFSVIFSSLNVNATVGSSLISVKFIVKASALAIIALLTEVFKIIVSSTSSVVSLFPENNNTASVSPAITTNCGETSYFCTL